MPKFELEMGLGEQRKEKEKTVEKNEKIAHQFAKDMSEKETNERFLGKKRDDEAMGNMKLSLFDKYFYQKLGELENNSSR